jgi:Sulfotransferase domain
MVLPNFVCVGAEKAGTTPLFRILIQHRDVFMPQTKETHWFSKYYSTKERAYYEATYFRGWRGQRAVGEATPEYMRAPKVPARLKRDLGPDIKLIFCLRDPVKRAHSHYLQCVRILEESESFPTALAEERKRLEANPYYGQRRAYLQGSLYSIHIRNYLKFFSREQMSFLLFEADLLDNRAAAIDRLFEFLEVGPDRKVKLDVADSSLKAPVISVVTEASAAANRRRRLPPGTIVFRTGNAGANRVVPNPSPQARAFFRKLARNMTRTLPPELEQTLYRDHFAAEIDALEELIGRDLSRWRR